MKQLLSILIILFASSLISFAQSETTTLKGKVTDQEKNEGIAFVSIGIEGTSSGTASNPEGFFELKIPAEHLSKNLYFSAIGYKNISLPISGFIQKQDLIIALVPQSYDIEEIDVAAESLVIQRILRTASEQIPRNYITGPLNLKIYHEDRRSTDLAASQTLRSIIDLYDAKAYSNPSWTEAFRDRSYRITESDKPKPLFSFRDASNNLDELLEMDLARLSNSILNPKLLNDFRLKMDAKTRFNRDSVWIISYETTKLDLAHTGSFHPTGFRGKIYISTSDYAVLRNEVKLTEAKANPQGRSLAVRVKPNTKIQMNYTCTYDKIQGKYILATVDSEKQYTSAEKQSVYESGKLIVLESETKQTRPFTGRNYFAEVKPNEVFWQNFKVPLLK